MLTINENTLEKIIKLLKPIRLSGKELSIKEKIPDKTYNFSDELEKLYGIKKWTELKGVVILEQPIITIYGKITKAESDIDYLRVRNFCYKLTKIPSEKLENNYLISNFSLKKVNTSEIEVVPKLLYTKESTDFSDILNYKKEEPNLVALKQFKQQLESDISYILNEFSKEEVLNIFKPISKSRKKLLQRVVNNSYRDLNRDEVKELYKKI